MNRKQTIVHSFVLALAFASIAALAAPWGPGGALQAHFVTLVPTEGGTVNASHSGAGVTVVNVVPAASLDAATLTADDGSSAGQILKISFVTMYAASHHITTMTFGGSNFSAAEITLSGGPAPDTWYEFVWNGSKWVLIAWAS